MKDIKKNTYRKAIIPRHIVESLLKINANYEQQGIILSDYTNTEIYNKVLVRFDENKNNEVCKMNDIVYDTISFHTHPKECYEMFKTTRGWPSIYDIDSFLSIDKIKVMIVLAIEGVYVMVKKKSNTAHLSKGIWELYNNRFKKVGKNVLTVDEYLKELNDYFGENAKIYLVKDKENLKDFVISFI